MTLWTRGEKSVLKLRLRALLASMVGRPHRECVPPPHPGGTVKCCADNNELIVERFDGKVFYFAMDGHTAVTPNKQLQRTVTRRRGRGASAPFHYAHARPLKLRSLGRRHWPRFGHHEQLLRR